MKILKHDDTFRNKFVSACHKHFCKEMSPHGHDFFEIELIIDGSGTYTIDGKDFPIKPHTLFLLNPSQIHQVSADMELINVMFSCEHDGDFFDIPLLNDGNTSVFRLSDDDYAFFLPLLRELTEVYRTDRKYALLLLRCILHKLTSRLPGGEGEEVSSYTRRAKLYVLQNFRSGITLESTAAHLGLSRAYLSDLFSKQPGENFKAYLDEVRFSYVTNLLTFTDLPIAQIHEKAGFCDYANFSRRFKQRYGISPGQYRRRQELPADARSDRKET